MLLRLRCLGALLCYSLILCRADISLNQFKTEVDLVTLGNRACYETPLFPTRITPLGNEAKHGVNDVRTEILPAVRDAIHTVQNVIYLIRGGGDQPRYYIGKTSKTLAGRYPRLIINVQDAEQEPMKKVGDTINQVFLCAVTASTPIVLDEYLWRRFEARGNRMDNEVGENVDPAAVHQFFTDRNNELIKLRRDLATSQQQLAEANQQLATANQQLVIAIRERDTALTNLRIFQPAQHALVAVVDQAVRERDNLPDDNMGRFVQFRHDSSRPSRLQNLSPTRCSCPLVLKAARKCYLREDFYSIMFKRISTGQKVSKTTVVEYIRSRGPTVAEAFQGSGPESKH